VDTLMDGVPFVGWALDTVFTGHAFAARALQKDIERRHGRPADAAPDRSGFELFKRVSPSAGRRMPP